MVIKQSVSPTNRFYISVDTGKKDKTYLFPGVFVSIRDARFWAKRLSSINKATTEILRVVEWQCFVDGRTTKGKRGE